MTKPTSRKPPTLDTGPLSESLIPSLVSIVLDLRPSWDQYLVRAVLADRRAHVDASTLVRAAIDAASDATVFDPRSITWNLQRSTGAALPRCEECGQTADRCARRPGVGDDHVFVEARPRAGT